MLSSLNFEVKTQQYFVSSSDMFLEKITLLKIWLNPALNLAILVDSSLIPSISDAIELAEASAGDVYK